MTLFRNFFSCVRGNRSHAHRRISSSQTKIKFGEPLDKVCPKDSHLPNPLFKLITFLAHEGIHINDLFRRPGNINQMNIIMKLLAQGKTVQWSNYNLYTAANIAKKYLLHLPGGLFGRKGEAILLATYNMNDEKRTNEFLKLLRQMIPATKELTILLFGILFRMVSHAVNVHHATRSLSKDSGQDSMQNLAEFPTASDVRYPRSPTEHSIESKHYTSKQSMLAEAVAKSVAGSLFHTCRDSLEKVEIAVTVLQNLILAFPSFDVEFIDFFDQAMNKLSNSTSSTGSSHEMSLTGSSKIVRKASELAVSLEMWSETFGKNVSQRSSLKESMYRHERLDLEDHKIVHVQLQGNYHANIPSIMITSPQGEDNESGNRVDRNEENEIGYEKNRNMKSCCETSGFRHHQARIQSMKRRHQANLQKRSDWFLNNTPIPASPVFRFDNNFDSIIVVTCGGSSICLGQAQPLASGNRCILLHSNNSALISKYLASSGPDILQSTPNSSRPYTPDYSMMSREPGMESYCTSLSNSDAQLYDTTETEINPTVASNIDLDMSANMDPEAPNSVPLIRRLLPSRSSTTSRKASVPSKTCDIEHLGSSSCEYECIEPTLQPPSDEDDKDDEDEFMMADTQSNYY